MVIFTSVILLISSIFLGISCKAETKDAEIILATTTSTYDSGLLDVLLPVFEEEYGYEIKPIAVGTGEAIAMGERGEADVILVHSRASEDKFIEDGYGTERFDVMHNDFVVIGPEEDPAGIIGLGASEAYIRIAETGSPFVSRGDNSGTNKKELIIWENAGVTPEGDWYLETGQGMGATLRIADEKSAYTMSDRGTFLSQEENLILIVLVQDDGILFNPYGIIPVDPETHPGLGINYEGAMELVEFITGAEGQDIIRKFGMEKFGQPLFYPDVIKK
ncbi:MAG: substrate-binding domain-containing protein [Actinomycetia bacterium]|nr:substrate-binding domain-containing protein [Actinomycetes bacterium]